MQTVQSIFKLPAIIILVAVSADAAVASELINLRQAVIFVPDDRAIIKTARRMLTEEVAKRTGINLTNSETLGNGTSPTILLCRADKAPSQLRDFVMAMNVPKQAEGFAIAVHNKGKLPVVVLAGRDERGVLFSVGRLLLQLKMKKKQLELPADYRIATAPLYPHRGHQIAYRNLSHCYDAWTADTYEQYMRELAVFGANAFETTSFSIDGYDGPHAKLTGGEMVTAWSQICADYGFSFWLFSVAKENPQNNNEQPLNLDSIPFVQSLTSIMFISLEVTEALRTGVPTSCSSGPAGLPRRPGRSTPV